MSTKILLGVGSVLAEPAPGLSAEVAGRNHVLQADSWAEALSVFGTQTIEGVKVGVESIEVAQFERTHGVVEGKFARAIDVLSGGETLLEHMQRFKSDDRRDAARQEQTFRPPSDLAFLPSFGVIGHPG